MVFLSLEAQGVRGGRVMLDWIGVNSSSFPAKCTLKMSFCSSPPSLLPFRALQLCHRAAIQGYVVFAALKTGNS